MQGNFLLERIQQNSFSNNSVSLDAYKDYLKNARKQSLILENRSHNKGLLTHIFSIKIENLVKNLFQSLINEKTPPYVLMSIGEFGRRDSFILSPIQFVLLYDDEASFSEIKKAFFNQLKQLSLHFTLLTYSFKQFNQQLLNDSILCIRCLSSTFLCGTEKMFLKNKKIFCDKFFHSNYFYTWLQDYWKLRTERQQQFNNTIFLQQPNIIQGIGGVRDFQEFINLLPYFQKHLNFDTKSFECDQLLHFYNQLLHLRNTLQIIQKNSSEILFEDIQDRVVAKFNATTQHNLSTQELLEKYYNGAQNLVNVYRWIHTQHQFLAKRSLFFFLNRTKITDDFLIKDNFIHHNDIGPFQQKPMRLLRAFYYCQKYSLTFSPKLLEFFLSQTNKNLVSLEDESIRWFLNSILAYNGHVYPCIYLLWELGLLKQIFPNIEKSCVQPYMNNDDISHYTFFMHHLKAIQKLDTIFSTNKFPFLQSILNTITEPQILYWTLLLASLNLPIEEFQTLVKRLEFPLYQEKMINFLYREKSLFQNTIHQKNFNNPQTILSLHNKFHHEQTLPLLFIYTSLHYCVIDEEKYLNYHLKQLEELYNQLKNFTYPNLVSLFQSTFQRPEEQEFLKTVDPIYLHQHTETQIRKHIQTCYQNTNAPFEWHYNSYQEYNWVTYITSNIEQITHMLACLATYKFNILRLHFTPLPQKKYLLEIQICNTQLNPQARERSRKDCIEQLKIITEQNKPFAFPSKILTPSFLTHKKTTVLKNFLNIYKGQDSQIITVEFKIPDQFALFYLILQCIHKHNYKIIHANIRIENPLRPETLYLAPNNAQFSPMLELQKDLDKILFPHN